MSFGGLPRSNGFLCAFCFARACETLPEAWSVSNAEASEDTDPLIGKLAIWFQRREGGNPTGLPIRPASVDEINLFPGKADVNAQLAPGFADFSKCELGGKYGGQQSADFLGVFIQ
jgi:hypothetical protein